jgi:4-amino-4-deoxy-L-arabinose transferase-like glycosyltransferase
VTHALFRKRLGPAVTLLAAVFWLAVTAWVRPLMLPDEGRYVGVAWEMLRSGNWLVPTLDGLPYFHKPPLFYWITSASLWAFGMHEWAARVAPLLGAMAAAYALYRFALRFAGEGVARLSLLVLVTQPLFFVGAQFANLDMLVAGCIAVTVLALASAVLGLQQGRPSRWALATAYAFAALGLLAKGLIGVVLPALVILAWLAALRRPRLVLSLLWWPGIALFLCIAAPWFVAMQRQFPEFADYFFVVQHFKRFAAGGFNNAQPFWFYLAVLPLLTLPWMAWLPAAAKGAYWSDPQHGPVRQLMWLWLAVVTIFFSLPQSKLVGYIAPVTVPLAFLIGDVGSRLLSESRRKRWLFAASAAIACATGVAVVVAAAVVPSNSLRGLSRTLAARAGPQDQVVFLDGYYFDVPFYASLRAPVRVIDNWSDPALAQRDDWHKELLDAQRFAPASAEPVLLLPSALPSSICRAPTTWLIGHPSMMERYPALSAATEIARNGNTVLWRLTRRESGPLSAADCPGTPSANSTGK